MNVSQVVTIDKDMLTERAGKVRRRHLELVFAGLDSSSVADAAVGT